MIVPHPESDLNNNAMVLGAEVVGFLKKSKNEMLIDDLMKRFLKRDVKRTPELLMEALVFLFSIGVIERSQYKIRLVGKNA